MRRIRRRTITPGFEQFGTFDFDTLPALQAVASLFLSSEISHPCRRVGGNSKNVHQKTRGGCKVPNCSKPGVVVRLLILLIVGRGPSLPLDSAWPPLTEKQWLMVLTAGSVPHPYAYHQLSLSPISKLGRARSLQLFPQIARSVAVWSTGAHLVTSCQTEVG